MSCPSYLILAFELNGLRTTGLHDHAQCFLQPWVRDHTLLKSNEYEIFRDNCSIKSGRKYYWRSMHTLHGGIDYRSYQMSHCVFIPMIFVSAIFARATLTAKMALTAKMRELHLLPKWRPTRVHKKSRTQFWLSDSSGIIYHLWRRSAAENTATECIWHLHGIDVKRNIIWCSALYFMLSLGKINQDGAQWHDFVLLNEKVRWESAVRFTINFPLWKWTKTRHWSILMI